ncbi:hypothetical protein TSAR_005951 [Trichomalopsis sarcophagae]|uniref:Uncharacterized protein n=1 Tax=Trichomalopsis sarcophagae TaxID=543379 RepID=A0A232FEW0_9HYME|nr:hypothetical protein TSAR_005951 [Trichomalopsis sarcophagae]
MAVEEVEGVFSDDLLAAGTAVRGRLRDSMNLDEEEEEKTNNVFDIRHFLKLMWTAKYLYVSIIEIIIDQESCNKLLTASVPIKPASSIFVHQHNPFNESYDILPLTKNDQLFNAKLINLHGYTLTAGSFARDYFTIVDALSPETITWDSFSGSDFWLMKSIAQALHFTINITTASIHLTTDNVTSFILSKFKLLLSENITGIPRTGDEAYAIAQELSQPKNGWILSVMKEPILPSLSVVMLSKFSPYVNEFDQIIRNIQQSGMNIFWISDALRSYWKNKIKDGVDATNAGKFYGIIHGEQTIDYNTNEDDIVSNNNHSRMPTLMETIL